MKRENLSNRVADYTSKFDASLNTKWDDKKDAAKVKERQSKAQEMTNAYYDIATDFYEYGWGQSFHFATRYEGEAFKQSLARHEHYLALRLGLSAGEKCVDIGCGVGGPLREISRFSGAHVTGLNNNEYQVSRAKKLNAAAGLLSLTDVVKADFMNLPFEAESFDKAYAIEAHLPRTGQDGLLQADLQRAEGGWSVRRVRVDDDGRVRQEQRAAQPVEARHRDRQTHYPHSPTTQTSYNT